MLRRFRLYSNEQPPTSKLVNKLHVELVGVLVGLYVMRILVFVQEVLLIINRIGTNQRFTCIPFYYLLHDNTN